MGERVYLGWVRMLDEATDKQRNTASDLRAQALLGARQPGQPPDAPRGGMGRGKVKPLLRDSGGPGMGAAMFRPRGYVIGLHRARCHPSGPGTWNKETRPDEH